MCAPQFGQNCALILFDFAACVKASHSQFDTLQICKKSCLCCDVPGSLPFMISRTYRRQRSVLTCACLPISSACLPMFTNKCKFSVIILSLAKHATNRVNIPIHLAGFTRCRFLSRSGSESSRSGACQCRLSRGQRRPFECPGPQSNPSGKHRRRLSREQRRLRQ